MMMNRNGQGYVQAGWTSQSGYGRPQLPDAEIEGELDTELGDVTSADWQQRAYTRQIIREFLVHRIAESPHDLFITEVRWGSGSQAYLDVRSL